MKRTLFASVFLIPAALGFGLGVSGCENKTAPAQETKADVVADFPASDPNAWVNGAPLAFSALRGKNVVLVDAWHPTCTSCMASVPAVITLERRFADRGLRVVGVSAVDPDDAEAELKGMIEAAKEEKMTWPTYLDSRGAWSSGQHVNEIPTFLIIGKDGKVLFRHHGKLTTESAAYASMQRVLEQATNGG